MIFGIHCSFFIVLPIYTEHLYYLQTYCFFPFSDASAVGVFTHVILLI